MSTKGKKTILFIPEKQNDCGGLCRIFIEQITEKKLEEKYNIAYVAYNKKDRIKKKSVYNVEIVTFSGIRFRELLYSADVIVSEMDLIGRIQNNKNQVVFQCANYSFIKNWHSEQSLKKVNYFIGDEMALTFMKNVYPNSSVKYVLYDYLDFIGKTRYRALLDIKTIVPSFLLEIRESEAYMNDGFKGMYVTSKTNFKAGVDSFGIEIYDEIADICQYSKYSKLITSNEDIELNDCEDNAEAESEDAETIDDRDGVKEVFFMELKYSDFEYIYTDDIKALPYWVLATKKVVPVGEKAKSMNLTELVNNLTSHSIDLDELQTLNSEELCEMVLKTASDLKVRFKYKVILYKLKGKSKSIVARSRKLAKKCFRSLKAMPSEVIKYGKLQIKRCYYFYLSVLRYCGIVLGDNDKELLQYKNKYAGQKCFLIGNGPSLCAEDLNLIKDEITFGCNKVYKMYDRTDWRPTYLCMIDALIAKYQSHDLSTNVDCPVFTNHSIIKLMNDRPKKYICARNLGEKEYRVNKHFESYYIPSGATVMTFMIELAVYMGFKDIYLLGVDCTSSLSVKGHSVKGYVSAHMVQKDIERIRKRMNNPTLTAEQVAQYYYDKSTFSYRVIKKSLENTGSTVYNSTRGGALEVFERVSLEDALGR